MLQRQRAFDVAEDEITAHTGGKVDHHVGVGITDPLDDQLYELYPSADYPTPKDAWLTLWSDLVYSCAAERAAKSATAAMPSFLYEVTRGFDTGSFAGQGAYHAIDMAYLFGNFEAFGITPDAEAEAISAAIDNGLATGSCSVVLGEDVGATGGVFRITAGMADKFGDHRIIDTPLNESGIIGTAIGMAIAGGRPIAEIQFDGFVFPAMDQLVSHLGRMRYRTRGVWAGLGLSALALVVLGCLCLLRGTDPQT